MPKKPGLLKRLYRTIFEVPTYNGYTAKELGEERKPIDTVKYTQTIVDDRGNPK